MAKRTKNAAAVALGRLGGLKGGRARAAKLSAAERSASASKAVANKLASWNVNYLHATQLPSLFSPEFTPKMIGGVNAP